MPGSFSTTDTLRFTMQVYKLVTAVAPSDITVTTEATVANFRIGLQLNGVSLFSFTAIASLPAGVTAAYNDGLLHVTVTSTYVLAASGGGVGRWVCRALSNAWSTASQPAFDTADVNPTMVTNIASILATTVTGGAGTIKDNLAANYATLVTGGAGTVKNNASTAATQLAAGGAVYDTLVTGGVNTVKGNLAANYATLVTGGAGTVKDNANSAAISAQAAASDASTAATAVTSGTIYNNALNAAADAAATQAIVSNELQSGGAVYDNVAYITGQLQSGGDVYDNVLSAKTDSAAAAFSADDAATQAGVAVSNTTPSFPSPPIPITPPPEEPLVPKLADQTTLLYWMLSGLSRVFVAETGRIYLDLTQMYPPAGPIPAGSVAYFQCWKDTLRTEPATTLAEVIVQDPLTIELGV